MSRKLTLIRHAAIDNAFTHCYLGRRDLPLSAEGCQQALCLELFASVFLAVVASARLDAVGIWITATPLVTTGLFSVYCKNKSGGLTGDTLDASCGLVEMVAALVPFLCLKGGGVL